MEKLERNLEEIPTAKFLIGHENDLRKISRNSRKITLEKFHKI